MFFTDMQGCKLLCCYNKMGRQGNYYNFINGEGDFRWRTFLQATIYKQRQAEICKKNYTRQHPEAELLSEKKSGLF